MEPLKATSVNSRAEELFVQLFCEAFGPEKTENLQVQYPCVDIYGRHRYIDFALESPESKIAIEIDGETYHNPSKVSENKYRVLNIAKYQPMAYVLAPENKRKLDQDMLFKGEKPEAWLDVPIDVDDYGANQSCASGTSAHA